MTSRQHRNSTNYISYFSDMLGAIAADGVNSCRHTKRPAFPENAVKYSKSIELFSRNVKNSYKRLICMEKIERLPTSRIGVNW
jgi:hypothetical protein